MIFLLKFLPPFDLFIINFASLFRLINGLNRVESNIHFN